MGYPYFWKHPHHCAKTKLQCKSDMEKNPQKMDSFFFSQPFLVIVNMLFLLTCPKKLQNWGIVGKELYNITRPPNIIRSCQMYCLFFQNFPQLVFEEGFGECKLVLSAIDRNYFFAAEQHVFWICLRRSCWLSTTEFITAFVSWYSSNHYLKKQLVFSGALPWQPIDTNRPFGNLELGPMTIQFQFDTVLEVICQERAKVEEQQFLQMQADVLSIISGA